MKELNFFKRILNVFIYFEVLKKLKLSSPWIEWNWVPWCYTRVQKEVLNWNMIVTLLSPFAKQHMKSEHARGQRAIFCDRVFDRHWLALGAPNSGLPNRRTGFDCLYDADRQLQIGCSNLAFTCTTAALTTAPLIYYNKSLQRFNAV